MKKYLFVALLFSSFSFAASAHGDTATETSANSEAVMRVMVEAEALVVDGRLDDANRKILAVFPEKTRTAAQSLVLGNVLFTWDPKTAYELHKRAALELTNQPQALFKWAMEQHRAGEYAAAAKTYQDCIKAEPNYPPARGLCAECLLRTGKAKEAVTMWMQFQDFHGANAAEFENLVCLVNSRQFPDRERSELFAKAIIGDIDSAERLIYLDCGFERDWWHKTVRRDYLKHDLKTLRKAKFKETARLNEILCAGDCAMKYHDDGEGIGELLRKQGFLVGDNPKLPQSGAMLAVMLGRAMLANVITVEQARTKLGPTIFDRAKATGDVESYRVAAALYADTAQSTEIDRLAWAATGEVEFAIPILMQQFRSEKLKLDDPFLTAAFKRFPEDATIAGMVCRLNSRADRLDTAAITIAIENAIKAEFSHFSLRDEDRALVRFAPSAGSRLSEYFGLLRESIRRN